MSAFYQAVCTCPRRAVHVGRNLRWTSTWAADEPRRSSRERSAAPSWGRRRFNPRYENESPSLPPPPVINHQRSQNYSFLHFHILNRFRKVLDGFKIEGNEGQYRSFGLYSVNDLERESALFRKSIRRAFDLATVKGMVNRKNNPLFWNLRNAFIKSDAAGLSREIKYAFQTFLLRSKFSAEVGKAQQAIADLRFPYEWYPATRMMQRTIHIHVGPTNSGKTYNALKALENAKTGIYAGPLRLLAHEIYLRFAAKGLPCALVTGEEQRIPEGSDRYFHSCTVEMSPLYKKVDVAVIDEIQMISDPERGWAWTQALLGIQARELHVCGEERAVELIQSLCARMGDKCVIHRYKRLNPLKMMDQSLEGRFTNLRKGDAVVSFSRVGLHTLKAGIEQETGRRCAIVYGSLPPETRVQQAALFNDPDNDYDFLVASDAIGMGLNLEIKRVVFDSASKYDGLAHRALTVPEIKQIGGRAGRFKTASQAIVEAGGAKGSGDQDASATPGLVTSLDEEDLEILQSGFEVDAEPLRQAGLMPPHFVIERFYSFFPPNIPFSFVLSRLRELSRLSDTFEMCNFGDYLEIAEAIEEFPLSIYDRCIFLTAPVTIRDQQQVSVLKAMASCVSDMKDGHLLDIKEIDLEILEVDRSSSRLPPSEYLMRLESTHKALMLYLWLSYRYQGVFHSQRLAFHVKAQLEEKITEFLDKLSYISEKQQQRRKRLRTLVRKRKIHQDTMLSDEILERDEHKTSDAYGKEGYEQPLVADKPETDPINAHIPPSSKPKEQTETRV